MQLAAQPGLTAQAITVEDELALCALGLVELVGREPKSWTPAFRREVERVRGHLAYIGNRRLLASSFGRESVRSGGTASLEHALERIASSPVHVAYATRWLELATRWQSPHALARRRTRRRI